MAVEQCRVVGCRVAVAVESCSGTVKQCSVSVESAVQWQCCEVEQHDSSVKWSSKSVANVCACVRVLV